MVAILLFLVTFGVLVWLTTSPFSFYQENGSAQVLAASSIRQHSGSLTIQSNPTSLLLRQSSGVATTQTSTACSGDTYRLPQPLTADQLPEGLSKRISAPAVYVVHGDTLAAIRQNIGRCQPRQQAIGNYHAITVYNLVWSYTTVATDNVCTTAQVKVGIAISQFLPASQLDTTATTAATTVWQRYYHSLMVHEDGHIERDVRYAAGLLAALQSLQAPCQSFTAQAAALTDSYVTLLNGDNELYDAQTNHGATQGAVL